MNDVITSPPAPVALNPNQEALLAEILSTLPRDRQLSWLQLGRSKANVKKSLEDKFLEAQGHILKWETMKIEELQTGIEAYKKTVKELPKIRKGFTQYLDRISDELISVEKQADAWEILKKAEGKFLQLREAQEKELLNVNSKSNEAARFRTHVNNQYIDIRSDYEIRLDKLFLEEYIAALKQELTDDGLKNLVVIVENKMTNLKKKDPVRFTETLAPDYVLQHTKEELTNIYATIPPPDYNTVLNRAIVAMREKFNLYWSDKASAEKAEEFLKQQQKENEDKILHNASTTQAVNTLVSKTAQGLSFSDIKPIDRKMVIVVKDSDPHWAQKIITEFLARWDRCRPRLRIKKWSNLSIDQMVSALQEEPEQISGLEYVEIKK